MTIALPGPGVLVRALTAALRGEPVALPAVLPPAPSGLGYPAPAAYPAFPMPDGAALAPAGLSPAGAIELAYLTELADPGAHRRATGGGPHPHPGAGTAGPRVRPIGSAVAAAQARSRAPEHRPHGGRPTGESRMSAMIIDLRTERLLRRGTRAAAARADARDAAPEETCPVLLFHRRPARTAPSTGPRHRADQRR